MKLKRRHKRRSIERYPIERSPFAQSPTQRELAELLGMKRDDLRRLVNYKDQFIVRRTEKIGGKVRDLAYPVALLRVVHEKLKFHLNKVQQPDYLFSPRKKRGQRDNAEFHLNQHQYLTLDLKQFYPSTTSAQVRRWLTEDLGMFDDVAGLLAHIATVDGVVSFGSPLTPVLCTLVHRRMFSEISDLCRERGLRISLWVDDVTISGKFVPGDLLTEIRDIIRRYGHRSHKIVYRCGNRPVFITGIGVVGRHLVAPNALHLAIKELWSDLYKAETVAEKLDVTQRLLSRMGALRHIVGAKSDAGRKVADQMNSLKQKRTKLLKSDEAEFRTYSKSPIPTQSSDELPWN